MRLLLILSFVLLGALAPATVRAQTQREAIAIVVHPSVSADNLTFMQLRQLFMGERQYWPDRTRVQLLVRAPGAAERELALDLIYKMSEPQFRQYWIAKIFRAEVTAGPKMVTSSDMVRQLVAALPGAISFIRASDLTPEMKVVRIDGRLPGERDYPLQ